MLTTEISSTAHDTIYDLLEFEKNVHQMCVLSKKQRKELPSAVREPAHTLEQDAKTITEHINDIIEGWLVTVIGQERGETDVYKINDLLGGELEQRGLIDNAIERARIKYSYYNHLVENEKSVASDLVTKITQLDEKNLWNVADVFYNSIDNIERMVVHKENCNRYGTTYVDEVRFYDDDNNSMIFGFLFEDDSISGWYFNTYDSYGDPESVGGLDSDNQEDIYEDVVSTVLGWIKN